MCALKPFGLEHVCVCARVRVRTYVRGCTAIWDPSCHIRLDFSFTPPLLPPRAAHAARARVRAQFLTLSLPPLIDSLTKDQAID